LLCILKWLAVGAQKAVLMVGSDEAIDIITMKLKGGIGRWLSDQCMR